MTSSPPVIDFGKNVSTTSSDTDGQVVLALENYGCFTAKYENLKVCHEELEKKLPELLQKNPQMESFDIPAATTNEGIDNFIIAIWPEGNNDMREAIKGYTTTAAQLEAKVREIVFEHYKIPKKSTGYIFRRMKYKGKVGLDRQDPAEFLAVLHLNQDNGSGKTKNGQSFRFKVEQSTFLIMAGEPLKDWSGGQINHQKQVVMDENKEKYSVGLFSYYDKGKIEDPKKQRGSPSRS